MKVSRVRGHSNPRKCWGIEDRHRPRVLLGLHLTIIPKPFRPIFLYPGPHFPASQDLLLPDIRTAQGKS